MALDFQWVSIPVSSELFRLAAAGAFADEIPSLAQAYGTPPELESDNEEFARLVQAIRNDRPDIAQRAFSTRSWHMIAYLISDETRSGINEAAALKKLEAKFIYGDRELHPHARTMVGEVIRFLDPGQVRKGSEFFTRLDETTLFQAFDAPKMETARLYKFRAEQAARHRGDIQEAVRALGELYRASAAKHDEGLLVLVR